MEKTFSLRGALPSGAEKQLLSIEIQTVHLKWIFCTFMEMWASNCCIHLFRMPCFTAVPGYGLLFKKLLFFSFSNILNWSDKTEKASPTVNYFIVYFLFWFFFLSILSSKKEMWIGKKVLLKIDFINIVKLLVILLCCYGDQIWQEEERL